MSKITVTTIAGLTSGGDANKVKIEDGDTLEVVNGSQTINRTGDGDLIAFQKGGADSGSISIESSGTAFDGESGHAGLKMFLGSAAPRQNGADVDNLIDLGWTGGRFKDIYLGGGLYVGGTGAANKFDDYEEGTWTATAGTGAGTLQSGAGVYTKIGRVVYVSAYLEFTGASTGGNRTYGGLPFPVLNHISASSVDFQGLAWSNNSAGYLYFDGGTSDFVNNHQKTFQGSFTANDYTRIQGFYFTT